jgi:hypothetical protein
MDRFIVSYDILIDLPEDVVGCMGKIYHTYNSIEPSRELMDKINAKLAECKPLLVPVEVREPDGCINDSHVVVRIDNDEIVRLIEELTGYPELELDLIINRKNVCRAFSYYSLHIEGCFLECFADLKVHMREIRMNKHTMHA